MEKIVIFHWILTVKSKFESHLTSKGAASLACPVFKSMTKSTLLIIFLVSFMPHTFSEFFFPYEVSIRNSHQIFLLTLKLYQWALKQEGWQTWLNRNKDITKLLSRNMYCYAIVHIFLQMFFLFLSLSKNPF